MARLRITLEPEWNKRTKKIDIFTDGQEIGTVYNGETQEFELPTGNYKLKAKTGWRGSQDYNLTVGDNETKTLKVALFKYGNLIITSISVIIALHFIASFFFTFNYVILLTIPLLLTVAYYLTLGRNDYLVITESR